MRLLTKNTLVLLTITLLAFSLGTVLFYHRLQKIMNKEAKEALFQQKTQLEEYIRVTGKLPESISQEGLLSLRRVEAPVHRKIKDTAIYVTAEHEYLPYKLLRFTFSYHGQLYACTLSKSLLESDDLIETILKSFAWILGLLILVFLLSNYLFSRRIWRPFFATLQTLHHFRIDQHKRLTLPTTGTLEFRQLNEAVERMTRKMADDFENLKSFSENASHELQTPLAIIQNKSEVLLQGQGLSEEQVQAILEIHQTAIRLSKLNQSLLLLSKIENQQFVQKEPIDFSELLFEKLQRFEELAEMKDIKMDRIIQARKIRIHPMLADSIVSNFLSNAIKYTPEHGVVNVVFKDNVLEVINTGPALKSEGKQVFQRFYKENEDSASTGLGLALVQQIAMANGNRVAYHYADGRHHFSYHF